MKTGGTCPRCQHLIPNDATPGAYAGAMSRKDPSIEICSACGTHEALQQSIGMDLSGPDEWPVRVPDDLYLANDPIKVAELKARLSWPE